MTKLYSFHLVENSPWPLFGSMSAFVLTVAGVLYMKGFKFGGPLMYLALILLLCTFFFWFRDIVREATYQGHHTQKVRRGLQLGMILFIVSEVCFFVAFFWAYFHSSLTPAVDLGAIWPPKGIAILNPWNVPLLNTVLLLSSGDCQIWYQYIISSIPVFSFSSPRVLSKNRIGPHNLDVLSIFMGSLLGDGTMERDGNGSRFVFSQENTHGDYLLWLHQTLFALGYCKPDIPKISSRRSSGSNIRQYYIFRTFTYSSFNWIYNAFYRGEGPKHKIVPSIIGEYLTPLALAIWLMDDGSKYYQKGIKFCTNSFTLNEVKFLANILDDKYKFKTSIHKTGVMNQYNIYIPKESSIQLAKIVKPYIHETMPWNMA
jgi:hypothetical protein